ITTELFLMLFGHRMDWFASFELSSLHYLIIEILAILVILVQLTLFFQATSKMAASEQKSFNLNEELGWLRNYFSLINHQIRSPLAATGMRFQMISKRNNAESPELIVKRNEFEDIQNAHNQVMDVADKFLSSWKYLDQNEVTSLSELANMKCEDFGLPRVKFESTRRLSKTESLSLNIAIDNFLDNALKYGGEEIRLSMPEENKLVIHDNGKGMSKEKLANIGSEYQPPSGSSSGTGMGMVLTRKVLDHMGWKYEIASNEHIGTRITLFKA
ncbi:MAG: two-component system sensor histidine kinase, partial [Bacteroidota bacterium]